MSTWTSERYCPTCDAWYPNTPRQWALFTRRIYTDTGHIVYDENGVPQEEMYYVCIACVHIRFYAEQDESRKIKKALQKRQAAA